jgi:hypothetical protein
MRIKTISLLFLPIVFYGCATMDASECMTADWQAIGYEDGSRGSTASRFGQHRKACSKHGMRANFPNYKKGYDIGVRSYCTPERGYSLGKKNKAPPQICPNDLIASVRHGYDLGYDLYQEKKKLNDEITTWNKAIAEIDSNAGALRGELEEHKEYLQLAENGLKDPKMKSSDRLIFYTQGAQMRQLIKVKQQEIDLLETEKEPYYQSIKILKASIRQLDRRPMPSL